MPSIGTEHAHWTQVQHVPRNVSVPARSYTGIEVKRPWSRIALEGPSRSVAASEDRGAATGLGRVRSLRRGENGDAVRFSRLMRTVRVPPYEMTRHGIRKGLHSICGDPVCG